MALDFVPVSASVGQCDGLIMDGVIELEPSMACSRKRLKYQATCTASSVRWCDGGISLRQASPFGLTKQLCPRDVTDWSIMLACIKHAALLACIKHAALITMVRAPHTRSVRARPWPSLHQGSGGPFLGPFLGPCLGPCLGLGRAQAVSLCHAQAVPLCRAQAVSGYGSRRVSLPCSSRVSV